MGVYQKLSQIREDFAKQTLTKSGVNNHADFMYYELKDIVPVADPIIRKHKCIFITYFLDGQAVGELINLEDEKDRAQVGFPIAEIREPAKFRMNEVQARGAEVTYMRRYLYALMLDLTDKDEIDGENAEPKTESTKATSSATKASNKKAPATKEERKEIAKDLTGADAPADELQIKALKSTLQKHLKTHPEDGDKVMQLTVKTNGFKNLTKTECEKLILKFGEGK